MKQTSRPGLPSSTPFSANGSILSAPWHTRHAPTLTATKDLDENSLKSTRSLMTKFSTHSSRSLRSNIRIELEQDSISDSGSYLSDECSFKIRNATDECSFKIRNASMTGCQLEAVRAELYRKNMQAESINESTQLAYSRMKTMENSILSLKEDITEKDRVSASRQRTVDKLISINMMLIDTLAALGLQPSSDKGLSKLMLRLRTDMLPLIKPESEGDKSVVKTTNDDIHAVNSKLKEGLLIMSREYYGSKKSMKSKFEVLRMMPAL